MTEENKTDLKDNYIELFSLAVKLAALYGIPAAVKLIQTLTNDKIDAERIAKLSVIKKPRDYFKCLSGCFEDRDCDTIPDAIDKCPDDGIPEGGCVTKDGCPDSDCDSVPDYMDKCPTLGAPEGGCVTVDGCPDSNCNGIADSDEK